MTKDEADERGLDYEEGRTERWRNKETGEIFIGINPRVSGTKGNRYDDEKWEILRDWGIYDEGISEDLDEIQKWLGDIVNINDHLSEIVREGPQAEWYGLPPGTDVWEHYGLDEEPQPPEELDWDSYEKSDKFVIAQGIRSTVTYSTPEGITPVNLHGD